MASAKPVRQAQLTGESIIAFGKTIYRMTCPDCVGVQWHQQGHSTCIYCDAPYVVAIFKLIPGNAPEVIP